MIHPRPPTNAITPYGHMIDDIDSNCTGVTPNRRAVISVNRPLLLSSSTAAAAAAVAVAVAVTGEDVEGKRNFNRNSKPPRRPRSRWIPLSTLPLEATNIMDSIDDTFLSSILLTRDADRQLYMDFIWYVVVVVDDDGGVGIKAKHSSVEVEG
jgi:hypothetical protein